jgi:hypothetical protein
VPLIPGAIEAIRSKQSTAPRTVLGFVIGMFSVVTVAAVGVTYALVDSGSSSLVPYVLAFIGLLAVGLIVAVLAIAWKDTSRLMLGQITGSEYESIRRLTMGNSSTGERTVLLDEPVPQHKEADSASKLIGSGIADQSLMVDEGLSQSE